MKSHLSSEDLDSALAGRMPAKLSQHVSECAQCAAEIAEARAFFGDFRQSAAVLADRAMRTPAQPARRQVAPLGWGLALATVFLGVMAPVFQMKMRHPATPQTPVATVQAAPTISDDALLSSVQDDLTSSVPASLLPLAGVSTQGNDSTATDQRTAQ